MSSGILKRGVTPQSIQEEVQLVLELQQHDATQQDTGSYQPFCMGPSALGVDDAISALQESVDWMRLRSYALPGGAASPPCSVLHASADFSTASVSLPRVVSGRGVLHGPMSRGSSYMASGLL